MRRFDQIAAVFFLAAALSVAGAAATMAGCTEADWRSKPTAEQLFALWPREAYRRGQNGQATIGCIASVQGALHDCKVKNEQPQGAGFGQAAIALTAQFTMNPKVCDGKPVESEVTIPIRFAGVTRQLSLWGKSGTRLPGANPGPGSTSVFASMPWLEAPTYAQVVAAYPVAARWAKEVGHVALECTFTGYGRLDQCVVVDEVPHGQGFGTAAKALSKDFVAPRTDEAGLTLRGSETTIAFTFDPAMLSGATPVIGKPLWTRVPQSVDMTASFPAAATAAHVLVGHVALSCNIAASGYLADCAVTRQSPEGLGFDKAAIALSTAFQVSLWTDEGLPTVGGHIDVPIRYEADTAAKP